MANNIQITEELFVRICKYHLFDKEDEADAIRQGLENKLVSLKKRDLYGKAIKGDEKARQEYLDLAGILKDFRW